MKFTIVKEDARSPAYGACGYCMIYADEKPFLRMEQWTHQSCAIYSLMQFGTGTSSVVFNDKKLTDEFIEWLGEGSWKKDTHSITYNAHEYLFTLSGDTWGDPYPALLKHPCVKNIDHWSNKAHGGHRINLYRLSIKKDFKHGNYGS